MFNILVLACWVVTFAILNYGSKIMLNAMPPYSQGVATILKYFLTSGATYFMILIYGVCVGLYLVALKVMPLSVIAVTFPILAILTTTALSICAFREVISAVHWTGIGFCLIGLLLVLWR